MEKTAKNLVFLNFYCKTLNKHKHFLVKIVNTSNVANMISYIKVIGKMCVALLCKRAGVQHM